MKKQVTNRPTPEFGYNQIDKTYFNIYLGYLISNEVAGKAGVGISTERGFRYGATHIYTINKNNTLELKTYNVEKTGFEGGAKYQWIKKHTKNRYRPINILSFNDYQRYQWVKIRIYYSVYVR